MLTFQRIGQFGQLGNQCFQFATLLAAALRNGYRYGLPFSEPRGDCRFSRIALKDGFTGITAEDSTNFKPKRTFLEADRAQWTFDPRVMCQPDDTDFQGYFQTYKYFHHIRDRILKEFTSKQECQKRIQEFISSIKNRRSLVFVHVRRGDALQHGDLIPYGNMPEWYVKASCRFIDAHFVVLSDDIPWCQQNLSFDRVTYSPFTDKFDDLELMRNCDGGGIISNSSFSWWGAYLGLQTRSIVAPAIWAREGVKYPDVMLPEWVKV